MLRCAILALAMSACVPNPKQAPVPQSAPRVAKVEMVHMCREGGDANKARLAELVEAGWQYAGPLYHDGINCTVTLWTCTDSNLPCARAK